MPFASLLLGSKNYLEPVNWFTAAHRFEELVAQLPMR